MPYLDPAVVQSQLVTRNIFTAITVPSIDLIALVLADVELLVDQWLGFHAGRKEYAELLISNPHGKLITSFYPLLSLTELKQADDRSIDFSLGVDRRFVWMGEARTLTINCAGTAVWAVYEAGYEPVPAVILQGVFSALKTVLTLPEQDASSLLEFDLQAKSVELPKGLKKEYFSPSELGGKGGAGQGGSRLDNIMAGAVKYRRSCITVGTGLN